MRVRTLVVVFLAIGFVLVRPTWAIILNNDSTNTSAPTGNYANSGWQWVGGWSNGSGIAISSKHFITAKHFSGFSTFTLNGTTYNCKSSVNDPNSDLRIVTLADGESFSSWASLYTSSDETGKEMTVYGRGDTKGDEITDKGWKPSGTRGAMWWGTNTVDDTASGGDLLQWDFDKDGSSGDTTYEAGLTNWDSGGGSFIKDGDTWKLAGVNYSVEGPFSENSDGSGEFLGALYDYGGLYKKNENNWAHQTDWSADRPYSSYATRISSNTGWINQQIPEPGTITLLCLGGLGLLRHRRKKAA